MRRHLRSEKFVELETRRRGRGVSRSKGGERMNVESLIWILGEMSKMFRAPFSFDIFPLRAA